MVKNEIILRGHWCWFVPLVLVLLVAIFVVHITNVPPHREPFVNNKSEDEMEDMKELRNKILPMPKLVKPLPDLQPLDAMSPLTADQEIKESYFNSSPIFGSTAQVLQKGWRDRQMPSTMEPYHGPILGFNCGQYSEYSLGYQLPSCFRDRSDLRCYKVTGNPDDYIFPTNVLTKGDVLIHENAEDIPYDDSYPKKDGISQCSLYDDGYKSERLSPTEIDEVTRPQYMYHRGSGSGEDTLVGMGYDGGM